MRRHQPTDIVPNVCSAGEVQQLYSNEEGERLDPPKKAVVYLFLPPRELHVRLARPPGRLHTEHWSRVHEITLSKDPRQNSPKPSDLILQGLFC